MKVQFAKINIGEEFTMNDQRFRKVETVYLSGCCVPEYNAIMVGHEDFKVCIRFQQVVERDEKNGE